MGCIGQWDRSAEEGHMRTTECHRYFLQPELQRNDGDAATLAFVTSPETVMALALAGTVDFDPLSDTLTNNKGEEVSLSVPVGIELPPEGFDPGQDTFVAPPADGSAVQVKVDASSERLQLLEPFPAWDGSDYEDLPVLVKARSSRPTGTMAGPAQVSRSSENISGNLYLGAVSAFDGYDVGTGRPAQWR